MGRTAKFNNYEEALEYYKNNHPVQTRKVFLEKYSLEKEMEKINSYYNDQYQNSNLDTESILTQRRERLSQLLSKPVIGTRATSFDYEVKRYEELTQEDILSIYELF